MANIVLGDQHSLLSPFQGAGGFETITGLSSAKGLTVPKKTRGAILTVVAQAVRVKLNGENPTGAVGFPLAVGDTLTYWGDLSALKVIEQAASATVLVQYLR